MSETIRIGIAGLGRIGWNFHAKRLRDKPRYQIAAIADMEEARRQEAATELGCATYASYDEMLAGSDLHAVVIATPTHLHEAQTLAALSRGLHVLLEKPMAMSSAEAERMVVAAEERELVLTVYQPHRLAAYFQAIRQILADGRIGKLCHVQIATFGYSRRNDWQSLQRYGGGMLNNYGAHYLDLLLQTIGYEVERTFCSLQRVATLGDADDVVKALIETPTGVLGELDISQASAIHPYRLNIWGTHGGLIMRDNELQVRWFDPAGLAARELHEHLASKDRQYPGEAIDWQEENVAIDPTLELDVHDNFADAVAGQAAVHVPPRETLALMRLLERLRADSHGIRDLRH